MRKNNIVGPIKGAGRPKVEKPTHTEFLNVRITKEAKEALLCMPRMERGKYISKLITDAASAEDLL